MPIVQINRDPFARQTLVRETIIPANLCHWCGYKPARFVYGIESDGNTRIAWDAYGFCSVGCRRAYYQ